MSTELNRPDGRGQKELRNLKVEVGNLDRADGSARVELGKNIAVATVYGPREMHPKHASRTDSAVIRINYRMATFSVDDYKRPYPSRREKEISKVLSEAYESLILNKNWPRSVIDVHIQIFQSDGGTRTASAIAITAALADAGIPMRDLAGSIASGLYQDHVVLDMNGEEDMKGTGDMPMMYSKNIDEVSLFQLDGKFTLEQFKEAFYTSIDGISIIVDTIKAALKEKYLKIRHQFIDDEEIDQDVLDQVNEDVVDEDEEEEEEDEDEEEEEEDEDEEEITPVPSEPIGDAHTASIPDIDEKVEDEDSKPASSIDPEKIESELQSEDPPKTSNKWFTKSGAELSPMGSKKTDLSSDDEDEEIDEEDEEDEEDESSSIMRDLEYSFDQEE